MRLSLVVAIVLTVAVISSNASPWKTPNKDVKGDDNPELKMTTDQIIANRGYPVEVHTVQTSDGYLLQAHRIPYGKNSPASPNKPVVFIQHGLLCESSAFIIAPVDTGLGYLLADAGYDVWMGAVRGNTYGRAHINLNPDTDAAFWSFSFDQIGQIDLPAQLNYVLNVTKQDTLSYIGHSQGTLTFFIMMETHPEMNAKVNQMFALAPVTTVAHMKSPIRLLANYVDSLEPILNLMGVNEFLPSSDFFDLVAQKVCFETSPVAAVCESVLFLLCGPDVSQIDLSLLSLIISHNPSGTSVRNMVHYGQEVKHAYYARYDHGIAGNMLAYGVPEPPPYDASKVTAPVMTFWGDKDWLADPVDVAALESQLPNLTKSVHFPEFNHLDFIWAKDVKTYINEVIIANLPIKP